MDTDYEIGGKDRPVKLMSDSPFFFKSNPLVKAEYLFTQTNVYDGELIGIRPVYIIGDLEILHDWLKAESKITNRIFNTATNSLYRYYKYILESTNAQSFTIEKNHNPFMQADILPLRKNDWPEELHITNRDYALWFLTAVKFREPDLVKNGFACLMEFLSRMSNIRFLYVRLQGLDSSLKAILSYLQFEIISDSSLPGYKGPIFRKQISK